ncbi:MAG: YaaR family protein [Spirochaetia bacterium]
MARIDSLGEPFQYQVPEKKKAGRREKAVRREFSPLVESASGEGEIGPEDFDEAERRRSLEELLDGVFSAGNRLKKAPTLDAIKDYRHQVRAFVKFAVAHSIAVEETTSGANVLKRKRFTMVKVIDEKLESLAVSVLAAQKDALAILAQIDEINGMLVNLVS